MVRNPKTSFYLIIVSALSGLKEIIDTFAPAIFSIAIMYCFAASGKS